MVPTALGVLGLVIGAIALFMSFSNSSKITQLNALADEVKTASDTATAAKTTADGLASKVDASTSMITGMRSQVETFAGQVKDVITKQGTDIDALKAQVASRGSSSRSSGGASGATSSVVPGQGGTHIIVAGDNFSNIAKKYGVTLADLEAANPGVDSSKLKLGQHITIPSGHSSGASSHASTGASAPASTPATGASSPAPAVAP